jgi:hypothetical protein
VDTKRKRLEWLGHVIRMDQRRVKKIFDSKPEGRRKVGRPRLRWLDEVENVLRVMKVKKWKKNAQNREEWASVIKEAKVLKDRRVKEQSSIISSLYKTIVMISLLLNWCNLVIHRIKCTYTLLRPG